MLYGPRRMAISWEYGNRTGFSLGDDIDVVPPQTLGEHRRSLVSSHGNELMVRALGDVIPGAHQRLELREGGVRLPRQGGLFRFFPYHLAGEPPEIMEHRYRQLEDLDLPFEVGLEALQRDRVLRVEIRESIDLDRRGAMIEHPLQLDGEPLVRLFVEAEIEGGAGLVPARVVVVPRRLVKTQIHVVMRPGPFGGVDHAPLEGGVDLGAGREHRRGARPRVDLPAEVRDPHLEPFEIADRGDLLPEPSG